MTRTWSFTNPELQRQLAMRCGGPQLGVALGLAILLLGLAAAWPSDAAGAYQGTALWMAAVMLGVFAPGQSYESMASELRDRTWDWQRLSALSAWQLVTGKLAGSTALSWIVSTLALLPLSLGFAPESFDLVAMVLPVYLLLALNLQITVQLMVTRTAGSGRKVPVGAGYLLGALTTVLASVAIHGLSFGRTNSLEHCRYWGSEISVLLFLTSSACVHVGWLLALAHSLMRAQLLEAVNPSLRLAFAGFHVVWLAGLDLGGDERAVLPPALWLVHVWFAVGAGSDDFQRLRTFIRQWSLARYAAAYRECPSWVALLAGAPLVSVGYAALLSHAGVASEHVSFLYQLGLVTMRDVFVLVGIQLTVRRSLVVALALSWLTCMHVVFPLFVAAFGPGAAALRSLFSPYLGAFSAYGVLVLGVETALAFFWLRSRYLRRFAPLASAQ